MNFLSTQEKLLRLLDTLDSYTIFTYEEAKLASRVMLNKTEYREIKTGEFYQKVFNMRVEELKRMVEKIDELNREANA